MTTTLLLRFEGSLQSWGERARWSVRDTASEPTKSGVVGLLACSLGWREDAQIVGLSRSLQMGVRCDKPGEILADYQTVIGGVISGEGKVKINANTKEPETVVSKRYYLSDAAFLVALQSDEEFLVERLAMAVSNPVWPYYLGRKSCPPTRPVLDGVGYFDSLLDALIYWKQPEAGQIARVRTVIDGKPGEGTYRRDEFLSFKWRTYLPRYIHEKMITIKLPEEEG